jgi:hypothetical protein
VSYRLATMHDVPAILAAGSGVFEKSPAPLMQFADIMSAELGVRDAIHNQRAIVVDEAFFVMFDVTKTWFSGKSFLIEDIVLRIAPRPGTSLHLAVYALVEVGRKFGCSAVVLGDSQIGYAGRVYEQCGFTPSGQQYIMRL